MAKSLNLGAAVILSAAATIGCSEQSNNGLNNSNSSQDFENNELNISPEQITNTIKNKTKDISNNINSEKENSGYDLKVETTSESTDRFINTFNIESSTNPKTNEHTEDYSLNKKGWYNPFGINKSTNTIVDGNLVKHINTEENIGDNTIFSTAVNRIIEENYTKENQIGATIKSSYANTLKTNENINMEVNSIEIESITRPIPDEYHKTTNESLNTEQAYALAEGFKNALITDFDNIEYENGAVKFSMNQDRIEITPIIIPYSDQELGTLVRISHKIYNKGDIQKLLLDYYENPQKVEEALYSIGDIDSYTELVEIITEYNALNMKVEGIKIEGKTHRVGTDWLTTSGISILILLFIFRKKLGGGIKNKFTKEHSSDLDFDEGIDETHKDI